MPLNLSAIEEFFYSVPVLNHWASGIELDLIKLRESKADKTVQKTQGDLATIDQVDTPEVVDEAVSSDDFFDGGTPGGVSITTTETQIGVITVVTDGGVVDLIGQAQSSTATTNVTFRIREDSTTGTLITDAQSGSTTSTVTLHGKDSSPSASQVYVLTGQTNSGSHNATRRRLRGTNRKK